MSAPLNTCLVFILAFFIGALPSAYLLGKTFKKIDIRQHGSGNVGATNAFRVLGKGYGLLAFGLDFGKGFLAVKAAELPIFNMPLLPEISLWIGLAAILGHVFTPFLGFKGGKGIATGAGVLCAIFPTLFAITLGVWLLVFLLTRIVSLSSLISVTALVIASLASKNTFFTNLFFVLAWLFMLWTHRANLARLIKGEEKKIG